MNLDDYHLFVRTVETGSITAAATALGLTRPTLSRRLSALEAQLGLALLHRTTRQVTVTPAGQRLFERMRPLVDDICRVEAMVRDERDEVSGRLRVSTPPVIAPIICEVLLDLARVHPELRIELLADIRWVDLRTEDIDVALRAGRVKDRDLVQRRLASADASAVAAPAYLERYGAPENLEALASHTLLRGWAPEGAPQRWWPLRNGGRVPVDGSFATDDQHTLRAAALAGAGIALLSEVTSADDLTAGRLVRVLPDELGARVFLHAVFARRTLQPARVRVFVDALARWFAKREDYFT